MANPKGTFKKGNKFATKNKGKPKKKTLEWEAFGKHLLSVGLDRASEIMQKSTDKEFMIYFLQLLEYFKPKMSRVDNNTAGELKLVIERRISEMDTSHEPQI